MTRGEIFSVVLPKAFGKPRPAVVVQSDVFAGLLGTTIVCPLTTDLGIALSVRPLIRPSPFNGLSRPSQIMIDKVQALPIEKVGTRMGRLTAEEAVLLAQALMIVLSLP